MKESKPSLSSSLVVDRPVSLKPEIRKVRQRICELKRINAWLRSYPGDPDDTLQIRKDISKTISQAIAEIQDLQEAYRGKRKPITQSSFNHSLKLYCPDLWDNPVKFERTKQNTNHATE